MQTYRSLLFVSLIGLSSLAQANTEPTKEIPAKPATAPSVATPAATTNPEKATTPEVKLTAAEIQKKILESGLNPDALKRFNRFVYENSGRSFYQDTYACAGRPSEGIRPCEEAKRSRSAQKVNLGNPRFVAIVDYSKPSSERRFYFIDRATGEVGKYYVSHGIGSGNGNHAVRFSNRKDSKMTSLGFYITGGIYTGKYGNTLRMYGVQKSNDQAYNRDIVLHGAWYVGEDFMNTINAKTKEPYGRLGVSWGCPAVSTYIASKLMPYLKEGSIVFHYHDKLIDKAQSGEEVALPADQMPVEKSTSNPEANTTKEEFDAATAKDKAASGSSTNTDSKTPETKANTEQVKAENKGAQNSDKKTETKAEEKKSEAAPKTPETKSDKTDSKQEDKKDSSNIKKMASRKILLSR